MDLSHHTSPKFLAEDRGPNIQATACLLIIFCTTFVALRYYSRYLTSTALNIEDVLIAFAWLAEMGLCIVGIVMVERASTGRHMAYILSADPAKVPEHFKGIMIQEVLHLAAVAFPKLAVLLLYLHILTNKYERVAAKSLIFIVLATWLSFTVAVMFQCIPFDFNWDKSNPNGRCFNVQVFANSSSVPNIVTDLAVLILPLRTVWCLKISIGRRIGLLFIFLTGSVGIVASIVRTVVFAQTLAEAGPLTDVTWNHVSLINWTMIEPGMYLLSACALSFKPLLRSFAKALHLQGLVTHTRSTVGGTKSHVKKISTATQTQPEAFELGHVRNVSELGKFHRLSDDTSSSTDGNVERRIEVTVTKTIELNSDRRVDDERWDQLDWASDHSGRAV